MNTDKNMKKDMKPSEKISESFKVKINDRYSDNVYLLRAFEEIGRILDELEDKIRKLEIINPQ